MDIPEIMRQVVFTSLTSDLSSHFCLVKFTEDNLEFAAEQGNAIAQSNLGFRYWFGFDDVRQDFGETEKWLRKSAEQGNPSAQYNLGCFYHFELGLPINSIEVVYWWREAAEHVFSISKKCSSYHFTNDYVEAYKQVTHIITD
jgi:TPR repeat protein